MKDLRRIFPAGITRREEREEEREKNGRENKRQNHSRLMPRRNLLQRNFISQLTMEFLRKTEEPFATFVSTISIEWKFATKKKGEKRSKRRAPRRSWDTRYTARTCARTSTSDWGPRTCVHSRVPTFIHSNTHRPRSTASARTHEKGARRGEGIRHRAVGRGKRQGGQPRDGKISRGNREHGQGTRGNGQGKGRGMGGGGNPHTDPLIFLDRVRNVAFPRADLHGRATPQRGCVDYLTMTESSIGRERRRTSASTLPATTLLSLSPLVY